MTSPLASFPKAIRVGPYTYTIVLQDEIRDSNGEHWGQCDNRRLEISFDRKTAGHVRSAEIALHEVLHAIWYMRDIPSSAEEEVAVNHFARGLVNVLRDNPALMKWLAEAVKS